MSGLPEGKWEETPASPFVGDAAAPREEEAPPRPHGSPREEERDPRSRCPGGAEFLAAPPREEEGVLPKHEPREEERPVCLAHRGPVFFGGSAKGGGGAAADTRT